MKYILTDIDGVCLDWQTQFEKFLQFHYPDKDPKVDPTARHNNLEDEMNQFIGSAWQGWCQPLRDAVEILTKLKQQGYQVHGCTAMGFDPYAIALRKINLERHFPNVFDRLDTSESGAGCTKEDWLAQYRGHKCVWIEDKWGNAIAGATIGHKTFLMRHEYNASSDHPKVTKVDNWQQIYYYIN